LFRNRFGLSGTVAGFPLMSLGLGLLVAASISPQILVALERPIPGSWGRRLRSLSAHCFAVMATLAYSTYLLHKEIGHLCRIHFSHYMEPGSWSAFLIAFSASLLAASLLYLAVERPFLRLRERLSSRRSVPTAESAVAS